MCWHLEWCGWSFSAGFAIDLSRFNGSMSGEEALPGSRRGMLVEIQSFLTETSRRLKAMRNGKKVLDENKEQSAEQNDEENDKASLSGRSLSSAARDAESFRDFARPDSRMSRSSRPGILSPLVLAESATDDAPKKTCEANASFEQSGTSIASFKSSALPNTSSRKLLSRQSSSRWRSTRPR